MNMLKSLILIALGTLMIASPSFSQNAEPNRVPVYRLFNPDVQRYLFVAGNDEVNTLIRDGWNLEEIAFYVYATRPSGFSGPFANIYRYQSLTPLTYQYDEIDAGLPGSRDFAWYGNPTPRGSLVIGNTPWYSVQVYEYVGPNGDYYYDAGTLLPGIGDGAIYMGMSQDLVNKGYECVHDAQYFDIRGWPQCAAAFQAWPTPLNFPE